MEKPADGAPRRNSSGKLRRLQMHAPSAIQVAPPPSLTAAGWNVVIPLLSPLNCAAGGDDRAEDAIGPVAREGREVSEGTPPLAVETDDEREQLGGGGGSLRKPWRHPAMPHHYQPAPANSPPAFVFPNYCT
ncbi:hypothetical protein ZIOFF_022284 [Zingiber officinale]|uniref:Uncharacterized protein n=1 Tax=Zingiber officinale TaxID=94328 RepID=A0A8J5H2M3_ZINOF|nr:hypothetical protein ZIOFF_022284 [Zingiber officinale]